ERVEAGLVGRGEAVPDDAQGREGGLEVLREAEDLGDRLPLEPIPGMDVHRRAEVEVADEVGEVPDAAAVAVQVRRHATSFGKVPTSLEKTSSTPGHAEASSFGGIVDASSRSMPTFFA